MNNYRVAIITRSYPPKGGGIAAAHFALAQCLRKEHDVGVFAFDDDQKSMESSVFRSKSPRWLSKMMALLARVWVWHYVKKATATNCERIFGIVPAIFFLNSKLKKFNPDFILCPDNYVPALALRVPRNAKLIWVAHNYYRRFEGNPIATNYSWIDLQLASRLELRGARKSDALVAVSQYMKESQGEGFCPGRPCKVIENFLDKDLIDSIRPSSLREKLRLTDDVVLIYIPSGGVSIKGERYLFEIIRRLGNENKAAFFVSGLLNPKLEFELQRIQSSIKVYSPGQQDYLENLSDVAACDFAISPTLIENLSSAFIESLALGVPIISFDVGGNKELITNSSNGWLVPYLDIESLIVKSRVLMEDKNELAALKKRAKSSVLEIMSEKRVLTEYGSLFDSLSSSCQP